MARGFVRLVLIGFVALACGCSRTPVVDVSPSPSSPGATEAPRASPRDHATLPYNVVLVSIDALRARETGVLHYPRPTTPNLDRLAAQSVVFTDAIAPASWTLPSTMAIFTGLYPSRHGVVNKLTAGPDGRVTDASLAPDIRTLPQRLHDDGYRLAAFTGDAGVSARFGYGRDFDTFLDDQRFGGFDHSMPPALAWLKTHKDERFFLFVHGYDCHGQFDPPEGYARTFAPDYKGRLAGGKDEQGRFREQGLARTVEGAASSEPALDENTFSKADAAFYQALYDEKIRRADQKLGALLAELDRLGLTDKTILVLLADHGEEFMEHGNIDHGPTLYQEMIHVPLIIKIPGIVPRRVTQRVSTIDALPTVLDALGLRTSGIDGVSLLPLLKGATTHERPIFSETDYRLVCHKRAVLMGRYKLIHALDSNRLELYDLIADPREQHPLDIGATAAFPALQRTLDAWVRGLPKRYETYATSADRMIKVY